MRGGKGSAGVKRDGRVGRRVGWRGNRELTSKKNKRGAWKLGKVAPRGWRGVEDREFMKKKSGARTPVKVVPRGRRGMEGHSNKKRSKVRL